MQTAAAYMDRTVDFGGDLLEMLRYQELLRDAHPGIYLWSPKTLARRISTTDDAAAVELRGRRRRQP